MMNAKAWLTVLLIMTAILLNTACTSTSSTEPDSSAEQLSLLAEIPEDEIFLYARESDGVLLKIGEHERTFDWEYMTPRMVMPEMQTYDVDADGENELVILLYIGSGTGVSINELRIIEFDESGHIVDHVFKSEDYRAQVGHNTEFRTLLREEALLGEITIGSNRYSVNLSEYQSDEYGKIADHLLYGNIVNFNNENQQMTVDFAIGIGIETFVEPVYIGTLVADVSFRDGEFRLSNFRYIPEEQYL